MESGNIYHSAKELTGGTGCKRLALISAGVVVAANVLLLLLHSLINNMMVDAVGIASLGKRSAMITAQNILQLVVAVLSPFWTYGFYRVAMDLARKETPQTDTLLSGFRCFLPLLRLMLLEWLIAMGMTIAASWAATMTFMMTPWATDIIEDISPALAEAEKLTDPAAMAELMEPVLMEMLQKLWPMYLLVVVAVCVLLIPWLYRLRLAPYHILDGETRARTAMRQSRYEMHGNCLAMFRLDLRWWWYYGLLILAAVPLYIYDFIGGGQTTLWVIVLLSYSVQLVVQWQLLPRVQTSYALAYDTLKRKDETDVSL